MRPLLLALTLLLVGCDSSYSDPEEPLDTTAPVITLVGANPMTLEFGEAYVEPGATAQDDTDGDLTAALEIDAVEVDAFTEGSYSVRYSVTDAAGNDASATRTVLVGEQADATAPVITLLGANPLNLDFGTAYVEPGATAQDDTDGDLTAAIEIDGAVDALAEGSYTIQYSVTDAAGNDASATRTVLVGAPPALGVATFEVTFASTWSAATHPTDFPSSAHFSRLVGAVHAPEAALFEIGGTASDGIKDMAERGVNTALRAEVDALGDAADYLSGPILNDSPDSGTMTFTANGDAGHTALSLVSMVAPSPDWFIGVDRLALVENRQWIDEAVVELVVYDAGTDSGQSYRAANAATSPREAIAESDHAYFADDRRLIGTLTIRRQL